MRQTLVDAIVRFGEEVTGLARTWWGIAELTFDTVAAMVRPGPGGYRSLFKQIVSQILFTGVEALWLVAVVAIVTGITVVLQATDNAPRFGVGEYFGKILIVVVVRELGPFFTGLIVSARSGAAFAAYVGNMRVTREIAALEVMGIDKVHFLVLPAFLGMVISAMCLNVYFALIALLGGLLVAGVTADLPILISLSKVTQALTFVDVASSLGKGILFGVIVAIVSGYYGLTVRSIREVPQAALKSVVYSMALMIIVNVVITITTGLLNA
jgi:phospholipid/cholesterol/gamma-HCH transport system permease protein